MKNLTKKNGRTPVIDKPKRTSKEELIDRLYFYLNCQMEIAERKKNQYDHFEEHPSYDKNNNPIRNPYLLEFNNQVDAIGRTSATIIRIDNSDLEDAQENSEESHKKLKELVD